MDEVDEPAVAPPPGRPGAPPPGPPVFAMPPTADADPPSAFGRLTAVMAPVVAAAVGLGLRPIDVDTRTGGTFAWLGIVGVAVAGVLFARDRGSRPMRSPAPVAVIGSVLALIGSLGLGSIEPDSDEGPGDGAASSPTTTRPFGAIPTVLEPSPTTTLVLSPLDSTAATTSTTAASPSATTTTSTRATTTTAANAGGVSTYYLTAFGLEGSRPSEGQLPDHDNDGKPGRTVARTKAFTFVGRFADAARLIDRPVLTLYSRAAQNAQARGVLAVTLLDCDNAGSNCMATPITAADVDRQPWTAAFDFTAVTVTFDSIDYSIGSDRTLALRLATSPDATDDLLFAYGTEQYAAKLEITVR